MMTSPPNPPSDRDDSGRRYLRFWGTNTRADVDEEIAFHLERLVSYYVGCGVDPDEARRLAADRFGDHDRIARTMRRLANQRELSMRRTEWVDVRTGLSSGPLIEVFGDLQPGDHVAVRGTDEIRAGTAVRVRESNPTPSS